MSEVSMVEELEPLTLAAALFPGCSRGFTQTNPAQRIWIFVTGPKMLCGAAHCTAKHPLMLSNLHDLQISY